MEDLQALCERSLLIDSDTRDLALQILKKCPSSFSDTCPSSGTTQRPEQQFEEAKRVWLACILFIAKGLKNEKRAVVAAVEEGSGITLTQLLESADVSLVEFLKELPVVIKRAEPDLLPLFKEGPALEKRLRFKELQTSFVYTTVIAKKCKDLYRSYFDLPVVNSQSALNDPESAIFRFTWLLYLVGKSTLLPQFPDLVTCFNLLVCVFNSVLANMPLQHCTHKFSDVVRFPVRSPGGGADTLHSITRAHKASLAEVSPLMASLDKVMRDLFASRIPPAEAVAAAAGEPVSVYSATVFPGLLSNPVALSAAIEVLSASYNQSYIKSGEIDERPFVEREAEPNTAPAGATPPSMSRLQVGTPRSLSTQSYANQHFGAAPSRMMTPVRQSIAGGPMQTPSPRTRQNSLPLATPVSGAMAAAAWLRDATENLQAEPSQVLLRFFQSGGEDQRSRVVERATAAAQHLFPDVVQCGGHEFSQPVMARERRNEGLKLYYRALEMMLVAEETRSGSPNLPMAATFHKCMLALAFELVVASHRMATMAFPAVAEKLEVKPFDLFKIIEPFIRCEPNMHRDLRLHLFSLEEQVLERLAWEEGSSLYPLLASAFRAEEFGSPPSVPAAETAGVVTPSKRKGIEANDGTPTKAAKQGEDDSPNKGERPMAAAENLEQSSPAPPVPLSPSRSSAFSTFTSPMGPTAMEVGGGAPAKLQLPKQVGQPPSAPASGQYRKGIVHDFLQKALKLAACRLGELCKDMDFAPMERCDIFLQTFAMLQFVVYEETHLLYNRHLDQILLSCTYGVCKVNQLRQVSFKEILAHYRRQSHVKPDIFRTVVLQQTFPEFQVTQTGDIIEFYNVVFIPVIKSVLLNVKQNKTPLPKFITLPPGLTNQHIGGSRLLANPLATPTAPPSGGFFQEAPSPARQISSRKIFVSPLRQSPQQGFVHLGMSLMTPKTRSLMAVTLGENRSFNSPSKQFEMINGRVAGTLPASRGLGGAQHLSNSNQFPRTQLSFLGGSAPFTLGAGSHSSNDASADMGGHSSDSGGTAGRGGDERISTRGNVAGAAAARAAALTLCASPASRRTAPAPAPSLGAPDVWGPDELAAAEHLANAAAPVPIPQKSPRSPGPMRNRFRKGTPKASAVRS